MKTALQLAAEQRLRRSLTAGELLLDLAGANTDLETGKARLRAAIEKEKRRALRDVLRHGRATLNVTEEMRAALLALFAAGQRHARAELAAHNVEPARALARDEPRLAWAWYSLGRYLHGIAGRIETAVGDVDPGTLRDVSVTAMVRELDRRVPGALDAASRLVSGAFGSGLAAEFGSAGDVVTRWQYSAVMDAATSFHPDALVQTKGGARPIQDVSFDDEIATHQGWQRPLALTRYRYDGELVRLRIGRDFLRVTPEHPILVVRGTKCEWLRADAVRIGERVVDPLPEIRGEDLGLGETQYAVAAGDQIGGLAGVYVGPLRVPVLAVGFDDERADAEVHDPSPDPLFALERGADLFEREAHSPLQACLVLRLSIAAERAVDAKLASAVRDAERLAASRAGAFLAPLRRPRAGDRAVDVTMRIARRDGERRAASRAELLDSRAPTRRRAEDAPPLLDGKDTAAASTRSGWLALAPPRPRDSASAGSTSVGVAASSDAAVDANVLHNYRLTTVSDAARERYRGEVWDAQTPAGSLTVAGVIVHNCPPCEEWDGEEFDSWAAIQEVLPDGGPFPGCDGNGRCRCRPIIAAV